MATQTLTSPPSFTSSIATASVSCLDIAPGKYGYVPPEACKAQWAYAPSFVAAIAFAVLFGIPTLAHVVLAVKFRKPFCWVMIMGAAWETAAFSIRSLGAHNQQNQTYAIASQLFFLLAPLWINAFVYMVVGRLVWTYLPDKKIWRFQAISLGKWFVWFDIASFLVQATGGSMLNPGNSQQTMDLGKTIYMSGVGVQQFFIFVFLALIVRFHIDALRLQGEGRLAKSNAWWKALTYALYAVLLLITMRIIFRLVEFSGGMDPDKNQIPYKEGYALGLDAMPMVLATIILAVVHPGLALTGPESEFPSRKEKKAAKKARKEEKKRTKDAKKRGYDVELESGYYAGQTRQSDEGLISGRFAKVARF